MQSVASADRLLGEKVNDHLGGRVFKHSRVDFTSVGCDRAESEQPGCFQVNRFKMIISVFFIFPVEVKALHHHHRDTKELNNCMFGNLILHPRKKTMNPISNDSYICKTFCGFRFVS